MSITLYKNGDCLKRMYEGKNEAPYTFVCVLSEPHDKTIDEAITKVENFLTNNLKLKLKERNGLTFTDTDNNKYVVGHELSFNKTTFEAIHTPSNIIRHVTTRPFSNESLYIDEHGETIDISHNAYRDIRNNFLRCNLPFYNLAFINPNIMINVMYSYVVEGYQFDGDIENFLARDAVKFKPIVLNEETIQQFTEIFSKHTMVKAFNFVTQYNSFRDYLIHKCGLQFNFKLESNPQFAANGLTDLQQMEEMVKAALARRKKQLEQQREDANRPANILPNLGRRIRFAPIGDEANVRVIEVNGRRRVVPNGVDPEAFANEIRRIEARNPLANAWDYAVRHIGVRNPENANPIPGEIPLPPRGEINVQPEQPNGEGVVFREQDLNREGPQFA